MPLAFSAFKLTWLDMITFLTHLTHFSMVLKVITPRARTQRANTARKGAIGCILTLLLFMGGHSNGYANPNDFKAADYVKQGLSDTVMLTDSRESKNSQLISRLSQDSLIFQPQSDGSEQVNIVLPEAITKVDIERQGSRLVIRLPNTKVDSGVLYQASIDQFSNQPAKHLIENIKGSNHGKYAKLTFELHQDFEYRSYQLGNQLTVIIQPARKLTNSNLITKKYSGKPISVDFQNVEVRSVLHLLSQFMETNIVASDGVTGSIMLNLINVPSDQALDIILTSKHLGKQVNGNVMMVAPLDDLAKQQSNLLLDRQQKMAMMPLRSEYIRLNYANAKDVYNLIEKTSSHSTYGGQEYAINDFASNGSPNQRQSFNNQTHSNQTNSVHLKNSLFKPNPTTLLSSRGVMAVDERTNTLIVKDTSASIDNIRALINKIDIPVQQVMIEARIVSASDNFSRELGVKWGMLSKGVANNETLLVGGSDQTLADLKKFSLRNTTFKGNTVSYPDYGITRPDNLNVDLGVANPAGSIAFGILTMSDLMIDLELSAMQAEGRGEVISTPKILTLDKQTAKVSSGTKIPYQSESEGGGTTTQFEEALLSLEVTPNITPEGEISMQLNIENGRPNPAGAGVILIDTDRLSTNVTVEDGQTIVLGGIFRNQIFNNVEKVPFFGDIPYLGRLFKKDMRRNDKQELLIFVTPTLIQ